MGSYRTLAGTVAMFVALVSATGLGLVVDAMACHSRWAGAGFKSIRYELGGCMLQQTDGAWIPASAVRYTDTK